MKRIVTLLLLAGTGFSAKAQSTIFEQSKGAKTATYQQVITYYKELDEAFPTIKMEEAGPTDTDYPLHVVYVNNSGVFDAQQWKANGGTILLINNGIHPGEPDGIDASMVLVRDIARGKAKLPGNIMLAIIPVFNIGGALNRSSHSRANQNGPEEYGFRGSAQNLDLNRDFMKMDAKETQSLVKLYRTIDPELFIDNHVSNGADYQHIMTLLSTQHNKLGNEMGRYLKNELEPKIYKDMKKQGYDLVPYVNHWNDNPIEKGWPAFYESPRFASGYTALFQTFGFVPETHMLKTYKQRVDATYALMQSFINVASENDIAIRNARIRQRMAIRQQTSFPLSWQLDTTQQTTIKFMGYESGYKPSEVSGEPRLYYNRKKPYTKEIPYFDTYKPTNLVTAPKAYVVQQGWGRVIERLQANKINMVKLERDTVVNLNVYYIDNYETGKRPYEGHYVHTNVTTRTEPRRIKLLKGDYIIPTEQIAKRYLIEALEPTAPDAFFAWGFFDAVLQQKEYFSDYVFEDEAAAILKTDTALRSKLAQKRADDTAFAKDGHAQIDYVYRNTDYYEPVHMRYPVFRID